MADFYTLLTNAGIAYETACKAAGVPIKLAQISVGDGNGAVYNPDATAKALKREVWRGPLNALFQDEKNPSWLLAEVTIPAEVGGWYVREAGLWTDTGILYAIVKYPESFKPVLATSGSGKEFYIRSIFETSNAAIVTLLIDDTVVKATRAWVMGYLADELAKLDGKQSVRVVATAGITLSGAQQIDGIAVVSGQRVLVTGQIEARDNGIYIVANDVWLRSPDANTSAKLTPGLTVMVEEGTASGDSLWSLVTNGPITLGTTTLVFEMLAGRTGIKAGTYKSLTVDKYGRATSGSNPTTLAESGILDAPTKDEMKTALAAKISKAGDTMTGALIAGAGVRSKKGIPVGDAANFGYAFGVDGDSGLFATEGPLPQSGSELLLMSDSIELARFGTDKSTIPNAVLPGATAVTPAPGTNSKAVATAEFVQGTVQAAINALVNGAPGALDTLGELAKALGGDANFSTAVTNAISAKLALSGGQMTGILRGKVGTGGPGNPNNCGFVFDDDTGWFSSGDGQIELFADGDMLMRKHASGALQILRGVRAPKGPPNQSDSSSVSGYSFAEDGDTGMFAEGGITQAGSDIVFRVDNVEAGRIKAVMKSSGKNGWARLLNGQILQWCEFTVTHVSGVAVQWTVTYPTSFRTATFQPMLSLGSGIGPQSPSYSVESSSYYNASGFAFSNDAGTRIYRLWAIGE